MTTSVFYDAEARQSHPTYKAGGNPGVGNDATSVGTLYSHLTAFFGGVTLTQSVHASASTANPTATFAGTPANGSALIAILIRGADNTASTNASWTLLSSGGAAGARRVEVWWRRAGASEPTTHTWTNANAALYELTLFEYGGYATIVDPAMLVNATNLTSGTSATFSDSGYMETICVVATSGGTASPFTQSTTGAKSVTDVPQTTTTRFSMARIAGYRNRSNGQGNSITWTTARVATYAQVGWSNGYEGMIGPESGFYGRQIGNNASTAYGNPQLAMRFDTSAIPDANTITSATLTLTSGTISSFWPTNTPVNVYSLAGAAISASSSDTLACWKTPTEIGSLTRVATRAAGSAWTISTPYAWTSDATFVNEVSKTGNTVLLVATGDQASGTTRATDERANIAPTVGSVNFLTVVHDLIITKVGGIVTAEAVPGLAVKANAFTQVLLRHGGIVTGEAFGGPRRFDISARIGSIATGEAFGGMVAANILARIGGIPTGEQVVGPASLTTLGFQTIRPGAISSAEAFGGFTLYKVGGTVYATHTVTGIVVASGPTVTGVVATVDALTGGAVSSTHLLQP